MIIHIIESYWIPSQKKTNSKLQIKEFAKISNFWILETNFTRDTPSEIAWQDVQIWNGFKEYYWRYRADTILSVHRRRDREIDKVKPVYPPFNFVEAGVIITPC